MQIYDITTTNSNISQRTCPTFPFDASPRHVKLASVFFLLLPPRANDAASDSAGNLEGTTRVKISRRYYWFEHERLTIMQFSSPTPRRVDNAVSCRIYKHVAVTCRARVTCHVHEEMRSTHGSANKMEVTSGNGTAPREKGSSTFFFLPVGANINRLGHGRVVGRHVGGTSSIESS